VLDSIFPWNQGRRVPLRFTLAPGCHIARLRRWALTTFVQNSTRWNLMLSYRAPSALALTALCKVDSLKFNAVILRAFGAAINHFCANSTR
jgi:hypothetical protein